MAAEALERAFDELDVSSLAFWAQPAKVRDETFATLRRDRPLSYHPPAEGGIIPAFRGFWAVVRHEDVLVVSRDPQLFCSSQGVGLDDIPTELTESLTSFLVMDAPRHTLLRRLVSQAFTPRRVARVEDEIRERVHATMDDVLREELDIVEALAVPIPLWTISQMVGVPDEHREQLYRHANVIVGLNDPDLVPPDSAMLVMAEAVSHLTQLAAELASSRRTEPRDDLMTALVEAEVDGQRLTDQEIGAFFVLLSVAGNDTTRNSISHGVHAFTLFPDQWELLRSDLDAHLPGAVDEIIRWASPVIDFARVATRDTELGGQPIAAGDKLVMFYASANRDEAVFPDPWRFDITRPPGDHVGFGGGGPHFCLGANLARCQLRAVFSELAERVRSFESAQPEFLVANFIHGIKRMPTHLELDDELGAA